MNNSPRLIEISSDPNFRGMQNHYEIGETELDFQHEWESFSQNLIETLSEPIGAAVNMPAISSHIEKEFNELWNRWNSYIAMELRVEEYTEEKLQSLRILRQKLQDIKDSFNTEKPSFHNRILQIIGSQKATWPKTQAMKNRHRFSD
jgi:hypothetical protein